MQSFPVYDSLISRVGEESRKINWVSYLSTISDLPESHKNFIYLLIVHHSKTSEVKQKSNPYGGKLMFVRKGFSIDINKLPRALQEIIYLYVVLITS
jgi:hypothetical protein